MSTRAFAVTTAVCLAISSSLLVIAAMTDLAIVGVVGTALLVVLALANWWWWTS